MRQLIRSRPTARTAAPPPHQLPLRPRVVAHRGASATAPENTLAAVHAAVAAGADAVEVDLHRTRDGALVVLHDATLSRTTDIARVLPHSSTRVADLTLDQVRRLDAGSWFGARWAGEPVPTLAEVVAALAGTGVGLLLEVKKPQCYPGIEADLAVELRTWQRTRAGRPAAPGLASLVVQSFDAVAMRRLRELDPTLPVGVLGAPSRWRLRALAGWADQVNPPHRTVDRGYVGAVRAAGLRCQTWTVDGSAAWVRAASLGVDGIITNRPAALRRLLEEADRPVPSYHAPAGLARQPARARRQTAVTVRGRQRAASSG